MNPGVVLWLLGGKRKMREKRRRRSVRRRALIKKRREDGYDRRLKGKIKCIGPPSNQEGSVKVWKAGGDGERSEPGETRGVELRCG